MHWDEGCRTPALSRNGARLGDPRNHSERQAAGYRSRVRRPGPPGWSRTDGIAPLPDEPEWRDILVRIRRRVVAEAGGIHVRPGSGTGGRAPISRNGPGEFR